MARGTRAKVSPTILLWARKSAGYSAEQVAARLKKSPEFIADVEQGSDGASLTIGQLRALAELYKRPLSDFFLPQPRSERPLPHDFRSPSGGAGRYSPHLIKELRRAQYRRDNALGLYRDLLDQIPSFDDKVSLKDDPEQVGELIRSLLKVSSDQQHTWGDGASAYKAWRGRLGSFGCLVFQFDTVPVEQVLGFSLTERPLPVIAVNVKMKHNGRTFTMLHEFVHVLLGISSVCDLEESNLAVKQDARVEAFCNAGAAAALMPKLEFIKHPVVQSRKGRSIGWTDTEIASAAKDFGVSREAFVRRLLTFELTTSDFYASKRQQYIAERASRRKEDKEKNKDKEMRRSWSERAISNLDRPFVQAVLNGYHSQVMTLVDASNLLDVRPDKMRDLESRMWGIAR